MFSIWPTLAQNETETISDLCAADNEHLHPTKANYNTFNNNFDIKPVAVSFVNNKFYI